MKEEIGQVNVLIDPSITRKEFKLIGPLLEIYDLPGIDDLIDSQEVFSFIENQIEYLIPIIIFPLTGSILHTTLFNELINKIQKSQKIYIVFTKLDTLITETYHIIKDEDNDIEGDELRTLLLQKITNSINIQIGLVLQTLPNAEIFIFNPDMKLSLQYKIENNAANLTFQSGLPGYIDLQKIDSIQMNIEQFCKT